MAVDWKCAISGAVPEEPVLSKVSGCIFEKKLLVEYINMYKKDPVNNQPITYPKDVVVIKNPENPVSVQQGLAAASNYSIPTLLHSLKNEWDAVMLENYTLRQQLQRCKDELSESLFKYDASVTVASNAMKERDLYKNELARLTKNTEKDYGELIYNASAKYLGLYKKLMKRKGKGNPYLEASADSHTLKKRSICDVTNFFTTDYARSPLLASQTEANLSKLEVLNVFTEELQQSPAFDWLTYKADIVQVYEWENINKILVSGNGKLRCMDFWTAKESLALRVWEIDMSLHSGNKFWYLPHLFEDRLYVLDAQSRTVQLKSFVDPNDNGLLLQLDDSQTYEFPIDEEDTAEFSCDLHKDGMLFALFNYKTSTLEIYDLADTLNNAPAQTLEIKRATSKVSLKFSENGYFLFLNYNQECSVIDLRKDLAIAANLSFAEEAETGQNFSVASDISGLNLFVKSAQSTITWFYKQGKSEWKKKLFNVDTLPADTNPSNCKLHLAQSSYKSSQNERTMLVMGTQMYEFK
ncbi:hypothetical protein ACO0RG_000834 [Hanseniaspora osmophila]